MEKRNIIVIGASAGGFEALKRLTADLPAGLDAAIFIVWHMSPDVKGILPQVLNRQKTLTATHAIDGEEILYNHIYIAPPDRHLILENGVVRVTRGPKENRFRPAVDPLFRSAAYTYGPRVIGIILSGALDDGTAGLWTVKNRGGMAIVQEPSDAEVPSMPESALASVETDHRLPVSAMGSLLVKLVSEFVGEPKEVAMKENKKTHHEMQVALQEEGLEKGLSNTGELTPLACPECHGVLSTIRDGEIVRYRCHTGHAFSSDTLLTSITENIEETLWSAIRGVEESIILLNHLGDHFAEKNQLKLAAMHFKKANDAENRAKLVRQAVFSHEQLTAGSSNQEAGETSEKES